MRRLFVPSMFALLAMSACSDYVPPCQDESGHVPYLNCERAERTLDTRPPRTEPEPPPPCDDCGPVDPPDDDPEPPGCKSGNECGAGFERDPEAYREWRERQGRPLTD